MCIYNEIYQLVKSAGSGPTGKRACKNKKPTLIAGLHKPWRAGTFSSCSLINRSYFRTASFGIGSRSLATSSKTDNSYVLPQSVCNRELIQYNSNLNEYYNVFEKKDVIESLLKKDSIGHQKLMDKKRDLGFTRKEDSIFFSTDFFKKFSTLFKENLLFITNLKTSRSPAFLKFIQYTESHKINLDIISFTIMLNFMNSVVRNKKSRGKENIHEVNHSRFLQAVSKYLKRYCESYLIPNELNIQLKKAHFLQLTHIILEKSIEAGILMKHEYFVKEKKVVSYSLSKDIKETGFSPIKASHFPMFTTPNRWVPHEDENSMDKWFGNTTGDKGGPLTESIWSENNGTMRHNKERSKLSMVSERSLKLLNGLQEVPYSINKSVLTRYKSNFTDLLEEQGLDIYRYTNVDDYISSLKSKGLYKSMLDPVITLKEKYKREKQWEKETRASFMEKDTVGLMSSHVRNKSADSYISDSKKTDAFFKYLQDDLTSEEIKFREKKYRSELIQNYEDQILEIKKIIAVIQQADFLQHVSEFFFPVFIDFRGRIYYFGFPLNPQGSQLVKDLLLINGELVVPFDVHASGFQVLGLLTQDLTLLEQTRFFVHRDEVPEKKKDLYEYHLKEFVKYERTKSHEEEYLIATKIFKLDRSIFKSAMMTISYNQSPHGLLTEWKKTFKEQLEFLESQPIDFRPGFEEYTPLKILTKKVFLLFNYLDNKLPSLTFLRQYVKKIIDNPNSEHLNRTFCCTRSVYVSVAQLYTKKISNRKEYKDHQNKRKFITETADRFKQVRDLATLDLKNVESYDTRAAKRSSMPNLIHSFDARILHSCIEKLLSRGLYFSVSHDCIYISPECESLVKSIYFESCFEMVLNSEIPILEILLWSNVKRSPLTESEFKEELNLIRKNYEVFKLNQNKYKMSEYILVCD